MPELTPSTREAARRLGVTDTAIYKAERAGRIAREPDGQWDIDKTRRRLLETADPERSPLAGGNAADGTPYARLKVAQLALKVEAQRLALDENKRRLLDVGEANATIDEIAGAMRDTLLNWPARVSGLIAGAETSQETLSQVKSAIPTTPVFANTGVKLENVAAQLAVADGAVVGTTFKRDGYIWNPVDETRVRAFMDRVRELRNN